MALCLTRQKPVVLNKKRDLVPAGSIYVGRPSIWGNPCMLGRDGTRQEVIDKYRAWLTSNKKLMARLHELRGKNLVCWCAPLPCHADVLMEMAKDTKYDYLALR